MKKAIIIFIALANIAICKGQSLRPEIDSLISKIASKNNLSSNWSGIFLEESDQRKAYFILRENATDAELIQLTKHENPNVRCYAFESLMYRENVDFTNIIIDHLYDTAYVNHVIGCMVATKSVIDYFIEMLTSEDIDEHAYKLSNNEKNIIDSILIFGQNINLNAKDLLLLSIYPRKDYYERIREIVVNENNISGLVALAKYKNQQDIELILDKLKSTKREDKFHSLWAVRYFPDSTFFQHLKEIKSKDLKKTSNAALIRMFYQALVQYKDSASIDLIQSNLKEMEDGLLETHSQFIWLAIEKYPAPMYIDIKNEIRLSENQRSDIEYWLRNIDKQ
ncbi:MAG: hypothetical protein ACOXZK_01875 [Bacteroidales bacterium]